MKKIRTVRVGAILDTMWGAEDGLAPPWFVINKDNFSGKRLLRMTGVSRVWVTNACKEQVSSAGVHGVPDPIWLQNNLLKLNCRVLLVCGQVAQRTYDLIDWEPPEITRVVKINHPAARTWTGPAMADVYDTVQYHLLRLDV